MSIQCITMPLSIFKKKKALVQGLELRRGTVFSMYDALGLIQEQTHLSDMV